MSTGKIPTFAAERKKERPRTSEQIISNTEIVNPIHLNFSSITKNLLPNTVQQPTYEKILEAEELKEVMQMFKSKQLDKVIHLTKEEEILFGVLNEGLEPFFAKYESQSKPPVAYAVGGWVRDKLLGRSSTDIDMVVYPSDIDTLEYRLLELPWVRVKRLDRKGLKKEVLRVDLKGIQLDIRGLDDLDLHKDVLTRDFDINSIYYNLKTKKVEDPLNAVEESLSKSMFRAAHNVAHVFSDKNRYLRLIRLKHSLQFEVEQSTMDYFSQTVRIQFKFLDKEERKRMGVELRKTFNQDALPMSKILDEYCQSGIFSFLDPSPSSEVLKELIRYMRKLKSCLEQKEIKALAETTIELERPFAQESEEIMIQGFCFYFFQQARLKATGLKNPYIDPFKEKRVAPGFGVPSFRAPLPQDIYFLAASCFFDDIPIKIFPRYYAKLLESISETRDSNKSRVNLSKLEEYILETDRNKILWAFLAAASETNKDSFLERCANVCSCVEQRNNEDPKPSTWNSQPQDKQFTTYEKEEFKNQYGHGKLTAGSLYRRNKKIYLKEDDGWED